MYSHHPHLKDLIHVPRCRFQFRQEPTGPTRVVFEKLELCHTIGEADVLHSGCETSNLFPTTPNFNVESYNFQGHPRKSCRIASPWNCHTSCTVMTAL